MAPVADDLDGARGIVRPQAEGPHEVVQPPHRLDHQPSAVVGLAEHLAGADRFGSRLWFMPG